MIGLIINIGAIIIGVLLCSFLIILRETKDEFRRKEWEEYERRRVE